jgi:outer membrane protein assembly factor BamB
MRIDELIFVGLSGYAMALHRDTGEIVWTNSKMNSGYVTLLLDGDRLIVSTNGYMYCLDPLTGEILWNNPLRGIACGPAAITSVRGQLTQYPMHHAAAAAAQAASTAIVVS